MSSMFSFIQSTNLPWRPFHVCFSSSFSTENRLAISSFSSKNDNWLKVIRLVGPSAINESVIPVSFPQASMCFSPFGSNSQNDLLLTSADSVKLWQTSLDGITNIGTININSESEPITCLNWSIFEESLVICGSTDGTVAALDLSNSETVSRIVAHDHPIFDINFCGSTPSFVTVGFEGSIRFFDLRDLQASFIFYQTSMPLLRVKVSSIDSNLISTFSANSKNLIIIDSRNPGIPVNVIKCANELTSMNWSNLSTSKIFMSDLAGNLSDADTNKDTVVIEANNVYKSNDPIQDFALGQGIGALTSGDRIELFSDNSRLSGQTDFEHLF